MEHKLIIDGNAVYELDLKCVVKKEKEKKNKEVKKRKKRKKNKIPAGVTQPE